jgi:hypothetical protein
VIGRVKLTADKRTNRIHIVSRPINMKLIRELVLEYDANVALPQPYVRPLRYRPVREVLDAIVAAIADPGDKTGAGAAGATPTGQQVNDRQASKARHRIPRTLATTASAAEPRPRRQVATTAAVARA